MMKLGLALDGVVNFERQITWCRIQNILRNWTKPMDKNVDGIREGVYKTVSVSATLPEGENGTKIFKFSDDEFPSVADQEQEEEDMKEVYGKPVRIVYLHPTALRNIKARFYITINPTQKTNDKLSQLLFVQNIQTAQEIFGPEALNYDYLKQRYATLISEDHSKMFKQMDLLDMMNQDLMQQPMQDRGTVPGQPMPPSQAQRKAPLRAAIQ
jgi:hypothetical protein